MKNQLISQDASTDDTAPAHPHVRHHDAAGSSPAKVSYAEAKRTLAANADPDIPENVITPPFEKKPTPGLMGSQLPESPNEDEDDEGRSESEQLVEMGADAAERDQILQAARAEICNNKKEP